MSEIYVYSPSGAVRDRLAFQRGRRFLTSMGHKVHVDEAALLSQQRFAGNDEQRLSAIERAAQSGARATLISRGGYGLTRLLHDLPYAAIRRSIDAGMAWVGYSDFTALQLAVWARTERITWAGPALCDSFGLAEGADDITYDCFNDVLEDQGEGTGWRMSTSTANALQGKRPGVWARDAMLWGGNLSVLCSLMGTPYFPNVKSGVLFLEDVAEHPYRVERMLTQLLHAGVLAQQKAIILGQFTDYKLTPHDRGYQMKSVLQFLRHQIKVPILTDLPFGHVDTRVCLPVGAPVDLLVEGRDAMLVWGHI
jgi:muramoyltetrapeptide carboxypeptidase